MEPLHPLCADAMMVLHPVDAILAHDPKGICEFGNLFRF